MRLGLHVFLVIFIGQLALLTTQFINGCEGLCSFPEPRWLVGALSVPLAVVWVGLVVWGLARLVRATFR